MIHRRGFVPGTANQTSYLDYEVMDHRREPATAISPKQYSFQLHSYPYSNKEVQLLPFIEDAPFCCRWRPLKEFKKWSKLLTMAHPHSVDIFCPQQNLIF